MDMTKKRPHAPWATHWASTLPAKRLMMLDCCRSRLRRRCPVTVEKVLDWTPKVLVRPAWTISWVSAATWRLVKRLYTSLMRKVVV